MLTTTMAVAEIHTRNEGQKRNSRRNVPEIAEMVDEPVISAFWEAQT